jgi:2-polyprenyl-3-methyl-5-hydroxy-6-metoxy-1,4-benzoquinol methylase
VVTTLDEVHNFVLKYMLFIIVHKEHGYKNFIQPHKLLNIILIETFEINNIMNQIKNKWKELWIHESFDKINKDKHVCCLELLGQVVEILVYVFTSVTNE